MSSITRRKCEKRYHYTRKVSLGVEIKRLFIDTLLGNELKVYGRLVTRPIVKKDDAYLRKIIIALRRNSILF